MFRCSRPVSFVISHSINQSVSQSISQSFICLKKTCTDTIEIKQDSCNNINNNNVLALWSYTLLESKYRNDDNSNTDALSERFPMALVSHKDNNVDVKKRRTVYTVGRMTCVNRSCGLSVHNIEPFSVIHRDGRIKPDDLIMEINGHDLVDLDFTGWEFCW